MRHLGPLLVLLGSLAMACGGGSSTKQADSKYIASDPQDPFHRLGCRWARKIDEETKEWFPTYEAAVGDGHRPCKVCRPRR